MSATSPVPPVQVTPPLAVPPPSPSPNRYRRLTTGTLSANGLLGLLGAAFTVPLLWLLFASFDSHSSATLRLPSLSTVHYRHELTGTQLKPFYNSLYIAVVSTVIATVLALLAGYALSRRHLPLKRTFMLGVLFMSGLPVTVLLVPTYQLYVRLNWLDSKFYTSLFIAATSLPFAIWLLKNFIDQVPIELEEAAQIDGAGNLQTLLRVVVPLAMPGIVATAMITFIGAWGAFVIPLVLDSNPADTPGSIAIYQFLTANGQVNFGDLAAYSILFAIPVVAIYLVVSRKLSGAFTFAGGIKT
jgi:multiple sugar transport system permease protein